MQGCSIAVEWIRGQPPTRHVIRSGISDPFGAVAIEHAIGHDDQLREHWRVKIPGSLRGTRASAASQIVRQRSTPGTKSSLASSNSQISSIAPGPIEKRNSQDPAVIVSSASRRRPLSSRYETIRSSNLSRRRELVGARPHAQFVRLGLHQPERFEAAVDLMEVDQLDPSSVAKRPSRILLLPLGAEIARNGSGCFSQRRRHPVRDRPEGKGRRPGCQTRRAAWP